MTGTDYLQIRLKTKEAVRDALDNGLSQDQIKELFKHEIDFEGRFDKQGRLICDIAICEHKAPGMSVCDYKIKNQLAEYHKDQYTEYMLENTRSIPEFCPYDREFLMKVTLEE